MIKAGEAYKISFLHGNTEKTLEEIEECIKKAAFNGSYKFVYPGALTANVQRELLLAEYETATTFENGKWYTVISWEI